MQYLPIYIINFFYEGEMRRRRLLLSVRGDSFLYEIKNGRYFIYSKRESQKEFLGWRFESSMPEPPGLTEAIYLQLEAAFLLSKRVYHKDHPIEVPFVKG